MPKVTIAAPDVMHYFLGPKAFDAVRLPGPRGSFFADLVTIYRDEIAELATEGCTYLQLDDTALPCNCDPHAREDVAARGEDPDELTERYAAALQRLRSRQAAEGHDGRRSISAAATSRAPGWPRAATSRSPRRCSTGSNADIYCLEYDTERAGDFSPLRFVPKGKRVILGLVSTKTPVLESKDSLKRQHR